ncbi:unnamed protein product, partial [Rotaria magnacalcarata]
ALENVHVHWLMANESIYTINLIDNQIAKLEVSLSLVQPSHMMVVDYLIHH